MALIPKGRKRRFAREYAVDSGGQLRHELVKNVANPVQVEWLPLPLDRLSGGQARRVGTRPNY
jgi:hypothetical protein